MRWVVPRRDGAEGWGAGDALVEQVLSVGGEGERFALSTRLQFVKDRGRRVRFKIVSKEIDHHDCSVRVEWEEGGE